MPTMRDVSDGHSLKSVAYDHIKSMIINCEIMPGERIREDVLAEQMHISRTPVREAVNRLVMDGLIVNMPRKGLYCMEITPQLVDSVCDLRKMVDQFSVDHCVGKLNGQQIEYLFSLVDDIAIDAKSQKAHMMFHTYFVKETGNSLLLRVESIYDAYLTMMLNLLRPYGENHDDAQSNKDHRLLVQSVRDGDREEAMRLCADHVDRLRKILSGIASKQLFSQ